MNTNIFPITAIVAIILFFIKETIEHERRKRADERKLNAMLLVCSNDIYDSWVSIPALENIAKHFTGHIKVKILPHYFKDLNDDEYCEREDGKLRVSIPRIRLCKEFFAFFS